jgi:4-amino-4-deoxy-L-arabinose transferase-like glycosyltransferase
LINVRSLQSAIRNRQSAIDLLLGGAFFALYLVTLVPAVLPADNGEFQLVAWKLGIAHPPGYPLYTLIGWLFSRFFASPAFALNLLSAILAALTLIIVSRTVRMLTQSIIAGILAAALLGVSTTFWAQATTANIRMPTAFFTALCVSLLVSWSRSRVVDARDSDHLISPSPRHRVTIDPLNAFAFVFALGLGHHLSLLFPGVFFILYLFLVDPKLIRQPRRWRKPIGFFALGLLPLLYLPLRGATGGTFANGEAAAFLAQPDQFFSYISGRGFEGDFFYFINTRPDLFLDRVKLLPTLFDFQFNGLVFILFAVGAVRLIWKDWKLAVMLLGGIVLHAFVTLAYRAPQTVEYLLPAYVLLAMVVGYGLQPFGKSHYSLLITRYALRIACCVAIVLLFASHFPSFQWLRANEDTRAYAEELLNAAPTNAILLSNWHWANPMWYLQQVEGLRTDVEVQYVFPRGEELSQSWLNAVDAGLKAGRPVIVNMFFRDPFNASPYYFIPISTGAYEVRAAPLTERPASFAASDIDFDGKFRIIGQQLLTPSAAAGEPLSLLVAYRVESAPDPATSFFVHLINPDGGVIGQADRTVQTDRYQVGDVFVERFHIAPLVDVPPGEYRLLTGAYTIGSIGSIEPLKAAGKERVPIATARVTPPNRLIASSGINLSGGIVYPNSSALTSDVKPGDEVKIDLSFTAARPMLRDAVVSVQMTGNGWRVTDDWVPALGAIPTLKWIAGSQVLDPHTLKIPDNAAPGPAQLSVILYDAFTQEPLVLLDAELIKQGQAIPIGTVNVEMR